MFTVDTRKPNCQIRIMYSETPPTAGPIYAGDIAERPSYAGLSPTPIAIILGTEHSDYSGDSVHVSNYRVLCESKDSDYLVRIYGSHGYQALAYDATLGPVPPTESLCEVLDALESYPVLDDDEHSLLEGELEDQAWKDDGLEDFRKALESLLDDVDEEHEHELPDSDAAIPAALAGWVGHVAIYPGAKWGDFLRTLWQVGCDEFNVNGGSGMVIETGCLVHFYVDEWFQRARDMERTNPSVARAALQAVIAEVAKASRIEAE